MPTITTTRVVSREQIIDFANGDNATVERWMDVKHFVDGVQLGQTEFVKLVDRPVSSFATLEDYDIILETDIVGATPPAEDPEE